MKKIFISVWAIAVLYSCGSSKSLITADKATIMASLDLNNVVDDQVSVSVDPGAFTQEEVFFYIPKTVPGTYSEDNYGKYVDGFKAMDYDGKELTFEKIDDNTWKINGGKSLDKVNNASVNLFCCDIREREELSSCLKEINEVSENVSLLINIAGIFPFGPLLEENINQEIDTLGGLVCSLAGRVPVLGECVKHKNGIEFHIIEGDARRIKKIKIRGFDKKNINMQKLIEINAPNKIN